MGLPGMIIRASVYAELDDKHRNNDLYWFSWPE